MSKRAEKAVYVEDPVQEFQEAMRDVTPLPDCGRVVHERKPRVPHALQRLQDDQEVLRDSLTANDPTDAAFEAGEELAFLRSGLPRQVLRKLRAGEWALQDQLDLHGLRWEDARALLGEFMGAARKRGLRCVLIVHGKGLRSKGGAPVLRGKVASWLYQRGDVLAFAQARPADGGSGAVVILLQGQSKRPEMSEDDDEFET